MQLRAPEPLTSSHRFDLFECGEVMLDDWLKRRALGNQTSGASKTIVDCEADARVRGFYTLAAGAVASESATGRVQRNMPDPIPVMVRGRLAVGREAQGLRLGAALLQDAVKRAVAVSNEAGVRAMLVHALHERAKRFYEHYGYQSSPTDPMTLMLRLPGDCVDLERAFLRDLHLPSTCSTRF